MTARLFTPLDLRGVTLRNRVMVSPMAQYSAMDGLANDWHFSHFSRLAMGGAGLVFTEAVKVEPRGMSSEGDLGAWSPDCLPGLTRIADEIRQHGAVPGLQLNHAGRKGWRYRPWEGHGPRPDAAGRDLIAPSAAPAGPEWPTPREMMHHEMDAVRDAFVRAAQLGVAAGFAVLELHAAHGYLLHQFLSPGANLRTDGYGGSPERRMRFPLEVTEAVRAVWPTALPLFVRVSAVDELGLSIEETVAFARALKPLGVDAVDCSSGGIARSPMSSTAAQQPGFQIGYAAQIRREAGIATVAVGQIRSAAQAERVLAEGSADIVALGRELLLNPFWPAQAAAQLGADSAFSLLPQQYAWWLARRAEGGI